MGGKKPACFSVRKREIKKRKNHWLFRQTVKKVADKLAGCNEGRSALHLKSAGGGMYVAEERQNAASSIIFWP